MVDVGKTATYELERGEGESVRGDDPLKSARRHFELDADLRKLIRGLERMQDIGRTSGNATRAPEDTKMSKNWAQQSIGRRSHELKRSMRDKGVEGAAYSSDLAGFDTTAKPSTFFSRST